MVMLRTSATTKDPTWGSAMALIWTEVEANASVICCCLPALRVPLLDLWRHVRGSPATTVSGTGNSTRPNAQGKITAIVTEHARGGLGNQSLGVGSDTLRVPSTVNSRGGESWYDRMMQSISKDEISRGSSQDGMVDSMEMGAIYKTTETHVSSRDLRSGVDAEPGRPVGLKEMLDER